MALDLGFGQGEAGELDVVGDVVCKTVIAADLAAARQLGDGLAFKGEFIPGCCVDGEAHLFKLFFIAHARRFNIVGDGIQIAAAGDEQAAVAHFAKTYVIDAAAGQPGKIILTLDVDGVKVLFFHDLLKTAYFDFLFFLPGHKKSLLSLLRR